MLLETIGIPCSINISAITLVAFTTLEIYSLNSGVWASLNVWYLARVLFKWEPPQSPGIVEYFIFLSNSSL